jgi:hypothetical protein
MAAEQSVAGAFTLGPYFNEPVEFPLEHRSGGPRQDLHTLKVGQIGVDRFFCRFWQSIQPSPDEVLAIRPQEVHEGAVHRHRSSEKNYTMPGSGLV